MAKSRRRSSGGKKKRVDWVVNADTYGRTSITTVPNGTVAAFPLTYPRWLQAQPTWIGTNIGGAAFPEGGQRQVVRAVKGTITVTPSSWVAGNRLDLMVRIVKKPMDFTTGEAIADALYSLYDADYANERFVWQHQKFEPFNTGANFPDLFNVFARVNQVLEPDEALFVIVEADGLGIPNLTWTFFLRTLMDAEGV